MPEARELAVHGPLLAFLLGGALHLLLRRRKGIPVPVTELLVVALHWAAVPVGFLTLLVALEPHLLTRIPELAPLLLFPGLALLVAALRGMIQLRCFTLDRRGDGARAPAPREIDELQSGCSPLLVSRGLTEKGRSRSS